MYLSKLEIQGFKSFANRTVVKFTKGITGIVGPNGCGKTNIVDAIRWALGEQKSSTLRSDKMENVIFNGSRSKKSMGMAEVSLTMVNDDGVLPTEYSEVTITRRIFRSGESEYLLNRQICRLKDITNLFMDTGMSSNAYSVIELKMVETILSSKAEERRIMFEEAAGVNKYKLRRRLSIKRLEEVKSDLTRVNDIIAEVEKKVRSLERQAKKADKYNQLNMVLKEKELDFAEREFSYFTQKKAQNEIEANEYKQRKDEIDSEIKEIENELIIFRDQIYEVESELKTKRDELAKVTERLHNTQKNISVAQERKKAFESNLDRFKNELEEYKDQLAETEESILISKDAVEDLESEIADKEKELLSIHEVIEQKQIEFDELKAIVKEQSDLILEKFKDINSKENVVKSKESNLEKLNKQIEQFNEKIKEKTGKIAKSVGYLEDLEQEKSEAVNKLEGSKKYYSEKESEKEALEKKLVNFKDKEFEEKSFINNLQNKIEFLKTLIENLEGVSEGARTLIESEDWTDKEKTLFADVGNTKEEFRFAMEAALKFVLNNLMIENLSDLKNAINYLKENDLGKASFFLLEKPEQKKTLLDKLNSYSFNKKVKKVEQREEFIGWAYDFIESGSKWRPYFKKILGRTIVVKDLDSAIKLHKKFNDFNYTTLEGDFVNSDGIIEAGSMQKSDETLFGRKQELEKLIAELPKFESNLKKLSEIITETEEKIEAIDLKELLNKNKFYENEITGLDKQISQLTFEKEKLEEEIEASRESNKEVVSEISDLNKEIDELKSEIDTKKEAKSVEEEKLYSLEANAKEIETELKQTKEDENEKKVQLERDKGKFQNTKNAITRLEESKVKIHNSIEKREKDIVSTEEEMLALVTIIEDSEIEYDEIYDERNKVQEEEKVIDERLKEIKREASKFEKQVNQYRSERQTISDKLHKVDIENNKISLKVENLVQSIREDYSIDLEFKEFDDLEEFDFETSANEVSNLKSQLKNLGPINLLAYSEYEEEKERLDFLMNQRNDLIESEKDLVQTIKEINETAQTLFKETFEQIRENFIKIFQNLFNPGDEADLKIQEGVDPLEAKIDIVAKPKGKRPTGIELLSGGEKTLTATALLFAIYLVKPSPFCILDEVDAPLDDANVGRYTKLIKEFSKNTQFVMVTHNKRTMEAAENMYGVTMQDEGISKLVGVQFNEDLKHIA